MMSLLKIIELIVVFFVIRSFLKLVLPSRRQNRNQSRPSGKQERFDGKGSDISDGDYDEIK